MSKEWNPRNLLDVLGDEGGRRILALASEEPRTAEELAENLTVSQPTVYRRLDALEDHDLVREERFVDDEGHPRQRYRTALESAEFEVRDGEFVIDVTLTADPLEPVD